MPQPRSHVFVARAGYAALLQQELAEAFGARGTCLGEDAVVLPESARLPQYQDTVFARQFLPLAIEVPATDQKAAVDAVVRRLEVAAQRANRQTGRWTLHAFALEDNEANKAAGAIGKAVLDGVKATVPRLYKRYVAPEDLVKAESQATDFVVQLYFPTAATLWVSIAAFSAGISPYIGGNLRMRKREGSPSRSARKLEEAFRALGRQPKTDETAVDLGAAPGGWTFTLARKGTSVVAVDALDLALPDSKALQARVTHLREDGLKYLSPAPVDWLCCDMIVASKETLKVLRHWLDKEWMTHFVVNLKLPKSEPWAAIQDAQQLFGHYRWKVMKARHLFHDRREVTLIGSKEGDS